MSRILGVLVLLALLFGPWAQPSLPTAQAGPVEVNEDPTPLVAGGAWAYTLAAPKIFWHTGVPGCIPLSPAPLLEQYYETIKRVPTYGGETRTLYSVLENCGEGKILSNLAADNDFIYWFGSTGLIRLSTSANVGDAPGLVNALLKAPGELAMDDDRIYAIYTWSGNTYVGYVTKSNKQLVSLKYVTSDAHNLQTDGKYAYYMDGGSLYRVEPGVGTILVSTGVTGYFPEGQRVLSCQDFPPACIYSDRVYVAKGRFVYIYNNVNETLGASPIFTSTDPTASITSLVSDSSKLFFIERRDTPCSDPPCLTPYLYVVNRTPRLGGAAVTLATYGPAAASSGLDQITTDGTFLFWHEEGSRVQRLPNDAAAMPQVDMFVDRIEVTQGIQNLNSTVTLIKNRRTFVRVYVKSAGAAVSGVTAYLYAPDLSDLPLKPVNPAGTRLTVSANPDRNDINQSFLFELPWSWTRVDGILYLQAVLNPNKVPLEPSYGDNTKPKYVVFQNSPTLSLELFRLNYSLNGVTYSPRYEEDVLKAYSFIQRLYPIGGAIGENFKPRTWDVDGGIYLGGLVSRTDPICGLIYDEPTDDVALCASYIMNGWLFYYRIASMMGDLNVGLNTNAFYYGMISDDSGFFPRGQAMYIQTSVGPAGTPGNHFNLGSGWDTDGSYADWYAAHEIGHSLGRDHPVPGSDDPATINTQENCGHSRTDAGYPYGDIYTPRAPIGADDGKLEGFDVGDPYFGIGPSVMPNSIGNDIMSYCASEWISDYTYLGMYSHMLVYPSQAEAGAALSPALVGDFLVAAGGIDPAGDRGAFSFLRRLDSVTGFPVVRQNEYSLRLRGMFGNLLATDNIDTRLDDTGMLGFGHVMNFVAGTRTVQLVRNSDGKVLASAAVSAQPPVVSDVALQGAPNPVTGIVTLKWNASDPDSKELTFDVAYSRDNGANFQPIANGLTDTTAQIDTAQLGGSGTARLRVIASDGANSAYADSAAFVMAGKPPEPVILLPEDNLHIQYGQLVNFSGMAADAQDGTVAASGLVWKKGATVLGTGPLLSIDNLPVGTNIITLTATNSVFLSASTSVTIIVDDDLRLPGPTLTVGPQQVGWQVAAGETQHQQAVVSIGNAGSGEMDWTASEPASWLTLSATSGSITNGNPFSLTLTADPAGLASGKTYATQLTITKPAGGGEPAQTIQIPVSLSVGAARILPANPLPNSSIYLPLVRR